MTPCILWDKSLRADGYGRKESKLAHRAVYEDAHGPIEEGLELHHLCETKACVNLDHLVLVTRALHAWITPRRMEGRTLEAPMSLKAAA